MDTGAIARFVLRHKAIVALAWVAMLVAAIALMPRALGALSDDFSLPDSESAQANGRILQFGGTGAIAFGWDILVITVFAVAIFAAAVRSRLSPEKASAYLSEEHRLELDSLDRAAV